VKLTGKIVDSSLDFISGHPKITLSINEKNTFLHGFDELNNKEKLSIEIKPYRRKRSLDANAYAWKLMDMISEETGIRKEEIYREYIKNIGGCSEIVCVRNDAVDKLCAGWSRNGIGWQTDTFPSKIEGCTNVILYYGSSTFDTKQMSRLIDMIVHDCEEYGIETKSPDEIANLKSMWGETDEKHNPE
jgi:hypothetical protein